MSDKIPSEYLYNLEELLKEREVDEHQLIFLNMQLKDPTIALVLSILAGYLGIDRFYLGNVGLGIGKLLTCGGLYIWWIIDMFLIMGATKQRNWDKICNYLYTCPPASTMPQQSVTPPTEA